MNRLFRALISDSNLGARLVLAFGLLIAIVVCLGLVGLRHLRADAELEAAIDGRQFKAQLSRNALDLSNLNNRITMQVFLIEDENEIDSLLEQRARNTEKVSSLIETLKTNVQTPAEDQLLDAIDKKRGPYTESYKKALNLLVVDKKPVGARAVMTQEALPKLLSYHAAWNAYSRYQNDQVDQAQSIASSNYVQTRIEAFMLISLAFVLSVAIAFHVTRNLTKHMSRRKVAEAGLRQARDELEMRVQERTSQLATANEELRKEINARKLIEDELRGSEDRCRQIVDCASDTIYRISPTGYFTFVNPSAAALVKRSSEECIGLHFSELIRGDYREAAVQFYRQQIKEKVLTTHFEFPAVAKDDSEVWIGQTVQLVIENNEVVELQGIARDITSRKEIEQQLLKSERHYRLLFESNPLPVWVYDVETLVFLAVNNAAIHHYGYSREEFLAMTISDIRPSEDIPALLNTVAGLNGGADNTGKWKHRKRDGSIIDVEITSHTLEFAGRPARIVLAIDNTERKQAREALEVRAHQQAVVTEIGQLALAGGDLQRLFDQTVAMVAKTFGVEYCKVLELLPDGSAVKLLAGVGWKTGLVGQTTVGVGRDSQAGFTLLSRVPVIVEDLRTETRFSGQQLLKDHGVVSGISVIVGNPEKPFGVMSAHTTRRRTFSRDDAHFFQSLANVLAEAIQRKRAEETLRESQQWLTALYESSRDGIIVEDSERIVYVNQSYAHLFGYEPGELIGQSAWLVSEQEPGQRMLEYSRRRLRGEEAPSLYEFRGTRKDGTTVDLEASVSTARIGGRTYIIAAARDITERKRGESEILLQTARFQQLFENAPLGILRVDQNDIVLDANKEFEDIFQFSLDEMRGRPINEIVVPKTHREEGTALSSRVLGGEIIDLEAVRQRKDGVLIPVQLYGVPIVVNEKSLGVFAIYVDLSERKREQEKIGQLAQIVESSHDAIIATDLQANIISWNQGAERIYGYRAEEIMGKHISLLAPTDRQEEISQKKRRLESERGDRLAPYEAERLRKDGQRIQVSVSLSRLKDAGGRIVGGSIIARDISERKRMEEERQTIFEIIQGVNTTYNLEELLNLIHESIGKLLYAENCFVALHDPATDLLHFPFWVDKLDPCPPPRPVGIGFTSYVLRTGKPILVDPELTEEMYRRGEIVKSGSSSASWLGVPLLTQSGSIGVLVVQHYEDENAYSERDLEFLASVGNQIALAIERRQAEMDLRATEDQLRQSQKMESIGTLAGGIAHDFNNLMTAVTGYSELALRSLKADDSLRHKIEEIKKAGERAASLTRQLLAFSRKQMLQPRVLDLNSVITGMGKMLTRVIGEEFDLKIELDASLGQVEADPGQVEQILLNLTVNARDAMPDGGHLTIKTENVYFDAKFSQRRSVVEPGHYVMLSVSDNGCGMDAETQTHIFEPFFTTKEVGKGTGLGLSTVYGIVKQSGGSIWVYSEIDRGSTFKIYLPRVDDLAECETANDNLSLAPRGSETILLVEDEDMVRELSKEILQEYGYAVITAPNGQEGLRICNEFEGNIDLMITDVVMPQMSGRQLAESIGVVRPDTRVLYMSGFTDDAVVRHGVLDDGVCFIQKPFSPDALAAKAREVLDNRVQIN